MHSTSAAGVYDAFHQQYNIPVDDKNWITNSYQAGKSKSAIFSAFFNINKIESLMGSYGLQFAWKLTFVNKWTVRLLGKAKPGKKFIKSNYEARKKSKVHTSRSMPATETSNLNHLDAEEKQAEIYAKEVRDLTGALKPLCRQISQLELRRMEIGRKVRKSEWNPDSNNYCELKKIRHQIADKNSLKLPNWRRHFQRPGVHCTP